MSPPVRKPAATQAPAAAGGSQAHWQTIGNDGTAKLRDYGAGNRAMFAGLHRKPREIVGRKANFGG